MITPFKLAAGIQIALQGKLPIRCWLFPVGVVLLFVGELNTTFKKSLRELTLKITPLYGIKSLTLLKAPRENEGTERDIQGVGCDMSIPIKLFLVLGGNGSLFPQTSA